VLPDFTSNGDLPAGVHVSHWEEFRSRFGISTPRRVWLLGRLQAALALAEGTGKLRRVLVWGSFVTTKASPKDIDLLLLLDEDFEVQHSIASTAGLRLSACQAPVRNGCVLGASFHRQ
jgi:hypothetical protein